MSSPRPLLITPMTDEQRKAVVDSYFKKLDAGHDLTVLFAENA